MDNSTNPSQEAQGSEGISLVAFIAALATALVVFGVQLIAFILLKDKLARIFKPKTYLVPERERTDPPPRSLFGWLFAIFKFRDREIINKCGLDAYFFLRYLQTLLIIFIPLGLLILPVLIPLNVLGGRGAAYALEFGNSTNGGSQPRSTANVTGLDVLAWGNVRPEHSKRYWGHLTLAVVAVIWVCGVFFSEFRVYIKVRQDYLTSAEHRLKASATTILVSAVPSKWLTTEALGGLYDVFPGGIRNIWINRDYTQLLDKIHERDAIFKKLEGAQTELIRAAKRAHRKQIEKEVKKARKEAKVKSETKEEKAQKIKDENADAQRLAQGGGMSTGDPHQVPHNVDEAIEEEEERARNDEHGRKGTFRIPVFGNGLAVVEKGLRRGFGEVGEAGDTFVGGLRNVNQGLNNQVETTNGFVHIDSPQTPEGDELYDQYGRYRGNDAAAPYGVHPDDHQSEKTVHGSNPLSSHRDQKLHENDMRLPGNSVRRMNDSHGVDGTHDAYSGKDNNWLEFWKPPAGGFASPIPTGFEEGDEFPLTQTDGGRGSYSQKKQPDDKKSAWKSITGIFSKDKGPPPDYPKSSNPEYREDASGAAWEKFLKPSDRPTHRLPLFGFLPIPFMGKKVDSIYYCREELARLNLEIEMDQKHPERFPMMNSAFIQFNHQVAAHMAAQSVTHHIPKHMDPRTVEISPKDVIWDNMAIKWWEAWLRTAVVIAIVAGMIILWVFPVAFTASLAQITSLANKYKWLAWLNKIPKKVLQAVAGVLPAIMLAILLAVVPMIFKFLAGMQGAKTGTAKQEIVQQYYFAFLFVQVFLVVSISGGIFAFLGAVSDITSIPQTLATSLPRAANYFFSYMILQALSTSAGTLLQIATLVMWYIMPKLFDNTARQKWTRNTTLPQVTWGTFFPVYTNFACIALIYIIVAPIIVFFAIITFGLLWIAHRYNMLYVSRFKLDTGGLLYPRAINQTFTGLYFMEVCLVGLFFLVRDEHGNAACFPQAIVMIVVIVLTVVYQFLLNWSFGPLLKHLPITFEDEAVLRDEAFERAQARRLGLDEDDHNDDARVGNPQNDGSIEMSRLNSNQQSKLSKLNPLNIAKGTGSWAVRSGRKIGNATFGLDNGANAQHKRKHRDLEAQKRIADALYGGYNDELEDLTPDERDVLVKHAFQHEALRSRRPTIWIPRDDIGVSDDEIHRTRDFAGKNIWISNVGAALDGKSRVVYGKNPPDFSEIDLINL